MSEDAADEFDEAAYLLTYPDVRDAVAAGNFDSGWQHYSLFGKDCGFNGRPLSRRDKLVGGLDLANLIGVEIGALASPLVRKSDGRVFYIDYADTATLRALFGNSSTINPDDIVEVDYVWGAQTLGECVGPDFKADYLVSSHAIEHVPDLVSWLHEIHEILRPTGQCRLAVPDRRFTFDVLRKESSLADVLDAYIRRARAPLTRAVLDHFLNYTEVDVGQAWNGTLDIDALSPSHSIEFAFSTAKSSYDDGIYQDAHCWVFTPISFTDLCGDLASAGLVNFICDELYPTSRMEIEFIAVLSPSNDHDQCVTSWRQAGDQLRAAKQTQSPGEGRQPR